MFSMLKILHTVTLILFSVSLYKICVESESPPTSNNALSVVPDQEAEDADDGVDVIEVPSEIEFDPDDIFYPTKEWQKVRKNQAIPAGLHVRLNLETGEKEAKLMEGDDGMKYWKQGDRQGMLNPKNKFFSRDELKKALKDFKAEAVDEETVRRREESIKKKFKKYEELKKDLESMNMDIKTDGEIISSLVDALKSPETTVNDKHNVLASLEYYLHQIDNAVMFCDQGGMEPLVGLLNHTHKTVRAGAAHALGAAAQSNPKVQVAAVGAGCVPHLIRLLSNDGDNSVRKVVLYALSSTIRQFPYAQQKFLHLGGLTALSSLFSEEGAEKLQVKAVTLLNDLLTEQEYVKDMDPEDSSVKMRIEQYKEVPLRESLLEQGWCDLIPRLLRSTDHDVKEKVLSAMLNLNKSCRDSFSKSFSVLQKLQHEYKELANTEQSESPDEQYFSTLLQSVDAVLVSLKQKDEL